LVELALIRICPSTNLFVESPLSPDRPSAVARVSGWLLTVKPVVAAWTLTCPAVVLLTMIVHYPAVLVVVVVQVPVAACAVAPEV
jgi:hypothetical protein